MGADAPVAVMTMSDAASTASTSSHGAADAPPMESAVRAACASERLTIVTRCAPWVFMCRAVSLPISPAPTTATVRPLRSPKILRARATAAKLTETAPEPSPVSVRTRLPAANDEWKSRFSTAPAVPAAAAAACASFTWPRICGSPTISESRPAATLNRWRATSRSIRS